jgi:hypothetical protein
MDDDAVYLRLTASQLDELVRRAGRKEITSLANVLSGLVPLTEMASITFWEERYGPEVARGRVSMSVIRGLLVLAYLMIDGKPVGVKEMTKRLGVGPSTTHRYLNTLLVLGLLEQDPKTRKYRLAV